MVFNKPIVIQKWNEDAQGWEIYFTCHARVNTSKATTNLDGGTLYGRNKTNFDVRFCKAVSMIEFDTQLYRIVYKNVVYDLVEYDDYMEQHRTVKLKGVGKRVG